DAERLFEVTRRGLAFFGAYFDFRYPFPKYDHIFIADYGHGAMENPGAVTMNERMIFRGPVSADGLVDRDATILHEMAH
ncbi:M1 family aminopeptidase, partial [Acinetobacter baumannii]